ncbi:hypothetical protein OG389_17370 [Streptomyces sp. NBC_00435]|uniref:hypothetical protein n=1 Tax=Streptomyces sp. NBC_00435 TaxID=2903649 RepID=UPI002E1CC422
MYLIHAALRPPSAHTQLPPHAGELVRMLAEGDVGAGADADADGGAWGSVEHVSTHPHASPAPVLGVYLIADSLGEAERRTEALCRRACSVVPALRGWTVGRVGVPLIAPYYEQLLLTGSGQREAGPVSSN